MKTYLRLMKKFISVIVIVTFLMAGHRAFSLSADSFFSGSGDVLIVVVPHYAEQYRYSLDIVFYSMEFEFNLISVAYNSKTGERYVNSGEWLMDKNATDSVNITVSNHSDTPVYLDSWMNASDFESCDMTVTKKGLNGEILPACKIEPEKGFIVSEGNLRLTLLGYPELASYRGVKKIYVTIRIVPVSGSTTNGTAFISKF